MCADIYLYINDPGVPTNMKSVGKILVEEDLAEYTDDSSKGLLKFEDKRSNCEIDVINKDQSEEDTETKSPGAETTDASKVYLINSKALPYLQ